MNLLAGIVRCGPTRQRRIQNLLLLVIVQAKFQRGWPPHLFHWQIGGDAALDFVRGQRLAIEARVCQTAVKPAASSLEEYPSPIC